MFKLPFKKRLRSLYVCSGILLSPVIGCGPSGLERTVVSGTAKLNGTAIEIGKIQFSPMDGTKGPASSATITKGEYRIDSKGGVPVGKHRVEIEGYRKATVPAPGLTLDETFPDQYVPAKYNSASELTTEITAEESPAVRDFDLSN